MFFLVLSPPWAVNLAWAQDRHRRGNMAAPGPSVSNRHLTPARIRRLNSLSPAPPLSTDTNALVRVRGTTGGEKRKPMTRTAGSIVSEDLGRKREEPTKETRWQLRFICFSPHLSCWSMESIGWRRPRLKLASRSSSFSDMPSTPLRRLGWELVLLLYSSTGTYQWTVVGLRDTAGSRGRGSYPARLVSASQGASRHI